MRAAGLEPDPWQVQVATTPGNQLLLCHRQAGKSTVVAAIALADACTTPDTLILLLSRSMRQSGELFRKVKHFYQLTRPMPLLKDTEHELELTNRSRIISLPASEETIVGFSSVRRIIPDEAARIPDGTIQAVRPMLAMSGGSILALSTPFGARGWFWEAWQGQAQAEVPLDTDTVNALLADLGIKVTDEDVPPVPAIDLYGWRRTKLIAPDNPRLDKRFLANERRSIPDLWFRQEWLCEFVELGAVVFRYEDLVAMMSDEVTPLFDDEGNVVEEKGVLFDSVLPLALDGEGA
jgi:hypothetical protein